MPPMATRKKKIRILIADQEGVFLLGLKNLFGVEDDLRVVAQAENSAQVVTMTKAFKPDILFVQVEILAQGSGDLLAQVRETSPPSKTIITASSMSEEDALRYMRAGASGVILKSVDPSLFAKSARKVMDNEVWLPKPYVTQMAKALGSSPEGTRRPADTLTRREKTIISYVMLAWRNREIARHLAITEQTVKNHLRTIYDKLGVSDRLELVLYALHQRLELPPVKPAIPIQ
jgi:DNA-binding NarL/FixJ family response regulator